MCLGQEFRLKRCRAISEWKHWHAHVVEGGLVEELTGIFPLTPTFANDRLEVGVLPFVVRVQNQEQNRSFSH